MVNLSLNVFYLIQYAGIHSYRKIEDRFNKLLHYPYYPTHVQKKRATFRFILKVHSKADTLVQHRISLFCASKTMKS